jgi:ribonucleoside-triphosphate reductase
VVELGRLPFLSQNPRDCVGDILPYGQLVDFDGLVYTIGLVGLDDMIAAITGSRMHESHASLRAGLQFVAELQAYAVRLSELTGFEIALARTPAETTAQRFATLDLFNDDPDIRMGAMQYAQGDTLKAIELKAQGITDLPIYYTNGTHVPPAAPVDLARRIDQEQKFFPVLDGGNIMHIWLGEAWSNSEGIYDFIMNLARNTQCGYFAFTKDFTVCTTCGHMTPGLADRCGRCGSASVDHMSRITGYLSAVSGWNAGKRQELEDRLRVSGLPVIRGGGRE